LSAACNCTRDEGGPFERLTTAQSSTTAQYGYAYDPVDNITTIQKPAAMSTLTYNGLNQIRTVNGAPFSCDANGNLVQDDQHTYRWDADNRLVGIGYKAQPSKQTAFRYDGLGRRVAIRTTNGGRHRKPLPLVRGRSVPGPHVERCRDAALF
jgi:YD repeat-containing protein